MSNVYMGQIMAECGCQHSACEQRGYCMAARIEELEAACWRMMEERDRAIGWRDSDKDRADAAEAKLAKAVKALEKLDVGEGWAAQIARTTLAEMTGGKDG